MDETLEEKLKTLECPFNWKMDEISYYTVNADPLSHEKEELIPILKLFRIVMKIFVEVKTYIKKNDDKESFNHIIPHIENLNELLKNVEEYVYTLICLPCF